jgi:hypothetical protein
MSDYLPPVPPEPPDTPKWATTVSKVLTGIGYAIAGVGVVALLGAGALLGTCVLR